MSGEGRGGRASVRTVRARGVGRRSHAYLESELAECASWLRQRLLRASGVYRCGLTSTHLPSVLAVPHPPPVAPARPPARPSQDFDGTRLSRMADGSWSVEMEGFAPIVGSAAGITTSPCPGVTLTWDAATGVVSAVLPDGGSVMAAPHTAAFVPPLVIPPPLEMVAAVPEQPVSEQDDDEEEDDLPPSAAAEALATALLLDNLAASPEFHGVFLFDPRVSRLGCGSVLGIGAPPAALHRCHPPATSSAHRPPATNPPPQPQT